MDQLVLQDQWVLLDPVANEDEKVLPDRMDFEESMASLDHQVNPDQSAKLDHPDFQEPQATREIWVPKDPRVAKVRRDPVANPVDQDNRENLV